MAIRLNSEQKILTAYILVESKLAVITQEKTFWDHNTKHPENSALHAAVVGQKKNFSSERY